MCGICFGVRPQPSPGAPFPVAVSHGEAAPVLDVSSVWAALVDAVSTRGMAYELPPRSRAAGPDHKRSLVHTVGAGQGAFELRFHACILHMRGQVLTQQPFTTLAGDVFLWNGEIFAGLPVRPSALSHLAHVSRSALRRTMARCYSTVSCRRESMDSQRQSAT